MAEGCAEWRGLLAEHAVGGATVAERVALAAHLEGCPWCRKELADLGGVVAALALADPDRLVGQGELPPPGLDKVLGRVGAERARRTRRRGRNSLVAAAAIVAMLAVSVEVAHRGGSAPADQVMFAAPAGVSASARLEDRPWGTAIRLAVSGLPPGEVHSVWLEDPAGQRTPAGTFTPVAGRTITVQLATAGRRHTGVALGVSDDHGRTVLRTPIPPGGP